MAPGFMLPNQEGKTVSLEDLRGKWVVLYFYPKDFTSGCSVEAHNFQKDLPKYVAKNATIVGVSVDEPGSHKSFCAKEGLNFTLLSDTERRVIALYGSEMNLGAATLAARNTFLIDPKGIIRKTYPDVSPSHHSEEVLADLERLAAESGQDKVYGADRYSADQQKECERLTGSKCIFDLCQRAMGDTSPDNCKPGWKPVY
ncbi:MAG: peroxiredoxin [Alphaproteobacteria bacterium]|nr:MAG: peroxiredoxin [Alphaproteobacteria bacterium]